MAGETIGSRVIEVHGINDLQKGLRTIDRDLARELADGLADAAGIVLGAARAKVPRRSGDAQASMKVRRSQRGANLAVGGKKAPYYPWLDFGGRVGRGKSIHRAFIAEGRYIYPTLREKRPEVTAKVDEVVARLARRAGFESDGTL